MARRAAQPARGRLVSSSSGDVVQHPRLAYGNAHGHHASMPEEALDSAGWSSFRVFLVSMEDEELQRTFEQLQAELAARQEQARDVMRLFFSSLLTADLERAGEE